MGQRVGRRHAELIADHVHADEIVGRTARHRRRFEDLDFGRGDFEAGHRSVGGDGAVVEGGGEGARSHVRARDAIARVRVLRPAAGGQDSQLACQRGEEQ